MNILVFSPTPIYPRDAGNRARCGWMVDKLKASGFNVIFIYFGQEGLTPLKVKKMQKMVDAFYYIEYDYGKRRKLANGEIWALDDWYQNDIDHLVKEVSKTYRIDVVLCNYVWQSRIFQHFHSAVKIIDTHDVMGGRHLLLDKAGIPRNFFYCTLEDEVRGLNRSDIVIGIQENETNYFTKVSNRRAMTIGMAPVNELLPTRPRVNRLVVGYFASDNLINRKVISDFIDFYKSVVNLSFDIVVGGGISSQVKLSTGISVVGVVGNPKDFYEKVDVLINPMLNGTGLKIKTVEALSYGKPVIGTEVAFEGLDTDCSYHQLKNVLDVVNACQKVALNDAEYLELIDSSRIAYDLYSKKINSQYENVFGFSNRSILNSARREVLFVTHANFWTNEYGSHIRIRKILFDLSKLCRVTLLYLGDIEFNNVVAELSLLSLNVRVAPFDSGEGKLVEKNMQSIPQDSKKNSSYNIRYKDVNRMIHALKGYSPEVCFFEYLDFAYLSCFLPGYTSTVIDTHDVKFLRRVSFEEAGLHKLMNDNLSKTSMMDEVEALNKSDCVISITREEDVYFKCVLNDVITVCLPTVTAIENIRPSKIVRSDDDLLRIGFVGGGATHNVASIRWFIDRVFSKLKKENIVLNIYGKACDKLKEDGLQSSSRIIFHGYVSDTYKVYDTIDLLVNPCFAGSGQKIKTMESIVYGVPVMGTSEAFSGYEFSKDFVFDTEYEFLNGLNNIIVNRSRLDFLIAQQKQALNKLKIQEAYSVRKLATVISSISKKMQ